jgi:hypothetical protein
MDKVQSALEKMKAVAPLVTERKNMFIQLFTERSKKKRFGPVWHLWHLFLALIPSAIITTAALSVTPNSKKPGYQERLDSFNRKHGTFVEERKA